MARLRKRRRRLSMTSLIDVIFLLLLFFMLSSTFSKFAEVELVAAQGNAATPTDVSRAFLQLASDTVRLNGDITTLDNVAALLRAQAKPGTEVLVSLQNDINAQRLTDLLVVLGSLPDLSVTVLGS
ncbi:biopolymer transporter ExbD [Parasulfitobacter algicola]|uniref:Biopolymer transporter ExbD n=1 Tax=Parasulfitobacter algicola TaxID=2614809 RepID=A0ABX2ITI6_9RHOB|nr:biopolymer transporter ExbD [Sulfitobacter algicola]NSX56206.1 biopolymer transporter ExbD [Sulfitobacter algicola]